MTIDDYLQNVWHRIGASLDVRDLEIPITNESQTLMQQLELAISLIPAQSLSSPEQEKAIWAQVLDYTMKVLLYLSLDDAVVQEERPYSADTIFNCSGLMDLTSILFG